MKTNYYLTKEEIIVGDEKILGKHERVLGSGIRDGKVTLFTKYWLPVPADILLYLENFTPGDPADPDEVAPAKPLSDLSKLDNYELVKEYQRAIEVNHADPNGYYKHVLFHPLLEYFVELQRRMETKV